MPPSAGRTTAAPPMPMNPDSFVKVSTTKEEVKRLEAPVDARGIETAELKASAVRVAAEHVIEIEYLNDINDKIVDAPEDVIY